MVKVKTLRFVSLLVLAVGAVLATAGLILPRFATAALQIGADTRSGGFTYDLTFGAFHMCQSVNVAGKISLSYCGRIDKRCVADLGYINFPPSTANTQLPDAWVEGCNKFNLFRGAYVSATLFVCLAILLGSISLCVNPLTRRKTYLGLDIMHCVLSGLAGILFIASLVTVDQTMSSVPDSTFQMPGEGQASVSVGKGTSFGLEGGAVAVVFVALLMWIVARFVGSKPVAAPEAMLLNGITASDGSYVPPTAGQQPQYFSYGAPPPQPNYQQYGGANPQYGNYGYGYQPPPPQQ